ncbi:Ras-related protein Rab-7a [Tritrichomonas foetus]|uniref:Ras-related protein Rab-7a n=1 Tax=Tritrichomonas foetus TaxID=1144522 RepID=A0A1J4JEH0_9EUKA|nr:Ras-related protein Rab-7a [Tritrichomonas foetus]|eukprot:OHS97554.1 Ras-related protein Rab-7a [Tritrichomonas foetus]
MIDSTEKVHFSNSDFLFNTLQIFRKPKMSNISIIGDAFVGKTVISNSFANPENTFLDEYRPTLGTTMLKVKYQGRELCLWDTGGMERYKSLAPVYYRNSNAAIIVYDITNGKSFENLEEWYSRYNDIMKINNPIIIVGNKADLISEAVVSEEEGRKWAKNHNCDFVQVSAKTRENLEDILSILIAKIPLSAEKPNQIGEKTESKCC